MHAIPSKLYSILSNMKWYYSTINIPVGIQSFFCMAFICHKFVFKFSSWKPTLKYYVKSILTDVPNAQRIPDYLGMSSWYCCHLERYMLSFPDSAASEAQLPGTGSPSTEYSGMTKGCVAPHIPKNTLVPNRFLIRPRWSYSAVQNNTLKSKQVLNLYRITTPCLANERNWRQISGPGSVSWNQLDGRWQRYTNAILISHTQQLYLQLSGRIRERTNRLRLALDGPKRSLQRSNNAC